MSQFPRIFLRRLSVLIIKILVKKKCRKNVSKCHFCDPVSGLFCPGFFADFFLYVKELGLPGRAVRNCLLKLGNEFGSVNAFFLQDVCLCYRSAQWQVGWMLLVHRLSSFFCFAKRKKQRKGAFGKSLRAPKG